MRGDTWIADGNRAGGADPNVAPEAHAFVRRQRIPIDEGDGQIAGLGREDLDRERVVVAGFGRGGDVEREQTPGARQLVRRGDLLAVQPDVGAEIDAIEAEPEGLSAVGSG